MEFCVFEAWMFWSWQTFSILISWRDVFLSWFPAVRHTYNCLLKPRINQTFIDGGMWDEAVEKGKVGKSKGISSTQLCLNYEFKSTPLHCLQFFKWTFCFFKRLYTPFCDQWVINIVIIFYCTEESFSRYARNFRFLVRLQ